MMRQAEHNVGKYFFSKTHIMVILKSCIYIQSVRLADSITASSIQMQEVFDGYRQSSDLASRNRVRESLNAAVQSLPDWPPQSW